MIHLTNIHDSSSIIEADQTHCLKEVKEFISEKDELFYILSPSDDFIDYSNLENLFSK